MQGKTFVPVQRPSFQLTGRHGRRGDRDLVKVLFDPVNVGDDDRVHAFYYYLFNIYYKPQS